MTDEEALLRAVLESPEDDAPRLVYADWLEERGEHHHGRGGAGLLRVAAPWGLKLLSLNQNAISDAGRERLRQRFGDRVRL